MEQQYTAKVVARSLYSLITRHHAATLLSRPATKCYQICVPVYLVDLASRHTDLGFCRFSAASLPLVFVFGKVDPLTPALSRLFDCPRESATACDVPCISRCLSQSLRASCSRSRWTCYLHDDASAVFQPDETFLSQHRRRFGRAPDLKDDPSSTGPIMKLWVTKLWCLLSSHVFSPKTSASSSLYYYALDKI